MRINQTNDGTFPSPKLSRKRTRSDGLAMRTVVVLAAVSLVDAFNVHPISRISSRAPLTEIDAVVTERPRRKTSRKSKQLVDEQLLEALKEQFVVVTDEPSLNLAETKIESEVPSSSSKNKLDDPALTATKKKTTIETTKSSTSPPLTQKRKSQKIEPLSRKTPEFTSLRPRRKVASKMPPKFDLSDGTNVSEYHTTELLTRDEEYALGIQVQFMCKCNHVHEGLALRLGRIPSIVEWAAACGFSDSDPTFSDDDDDDSFEELRPTGYQDMFVATDPRKFVGNGRVKDAGVGRGRGRQKDPAPAQLGKFYDDSAYKAQVRAYERGGRDGPEPKYSNKQPMNRGTATEFVKCIEQAREAKRRMVQSNMRLVVSIANKYRRGAVGFQDLVQEGSLGLHRATEKFDPRKGFKFSTYASWWIQQAIFRCHAYNSRTIRLPVHIHNLLHKIRRTRQELHRKFGRRPSNEEMAEMLSLPLAKYIKIVSLTTQSVSLDIAAYAHNPKDFGHESDDTLSDILSSTDSAAQEGLDRSLFREDLQEMMKVLTGDEKNVIIARYGLVDGQTRTVTAVAHNMRRTKAWVRSQECRALRKLRRPWYEKKMREHQQALMQ